MRVNQRVPGVDGDLNQDLVVVEERGGTWRNVVDVSHACNHDDYFCLLLLSLYFILFSFLFILLHVLHVRFCICNILYICILTFL